MSPQQQTTNDKQQTFFRSPCPSMNSVSQWFCLFHSQYHVPPTTNNKRQTTNILPLSVSLHELRVSVVLSFSFPIPCSPNNKQQTTNNEHSSALRVPP